jgi:hypothetical protein
MEYPGCFIDAEMWMNAAEHNQHFDQQCMDHRMYNSPQYRGSQ